MKKTIWNKGFAALALGMGLLAAGPSMDSAAAQLLPDGLYAGEQSLGGMTREEAGQAVQTYVDGLSGQTVTLEIDGQEFSATAADLGFHWSNPDVLDETADRYEYGNLIQQYMAKKDLEQAPAQLAVETQVDGEKVERFVEEHCQGIAQEAKDATIVRENGQFVISESVPGKTVDLAAAQETLNQALAQGLDEPVHAKVEVTVQEPRITTEALATIQDVLGTFTTDFSSSGSARATNVSVGASKINGHVLMPGETLSGYECLQPFTTANGYKSAASYENGKVVDSIGGGVCQIATTLYNAALRAELEIVQRQNHSMIVTYVEPSMDAAIAGTVKDIKFSNNYDTPIYVEGYTNNRKLTFTIYGQETRPENRKVEYVSETLQTTSPGAPQEIVDNSLAPGARVRVQSAHTGLKSRLWKVVTVDGVETERTLLHTDTYNASKAIYRVGPAAPAATAPAETAPAPTSAAPTEPAQTQPATGVDGGPGVTGAPTPAAPSEPAQIQPVQPETSETPAATAPAQTPGPGGNSESPAGPAAGPGAS